MDYSKLSSYATKKDWGAFWTEYQVQARKDGKIKDDSSKDAFDRLKSEAKSSYDGYQNEPKGGGDNGSGGGGGGGIVGGITSGLRAMGSKSTSYDTGENKGVEAVLGSVFDTTTGKLKSVKEIISGIKDGIGEGIVLQLKQQAELQEKINTQTAMTGQLSEDFRSSITAAYPSAVRLGISFEDMTDAISNMTANMGRFRLLNEETMVDVAETGKVYFDSMNEAGQAANAFQNVSLGARDSMLAIQKAGKSSLELGLNSKATTKDLVANIDKLNQFGFNKGVDGLNQMVQKSQALKMNMQSVFTVAEQVMSPEGALELAANLQSIGGALGDFADPIKMLYDSTNNVEGLQDAIVGAAESLATYNSETGRMEVTGANLRKAREMAKALNMDLGELTKTAVNAAQRTAAATDLMSAGLTFKNDDDREFLTNLAQMKDGKMVIEVPKNLQEAMGGTTVALDALSETQKETLLKYREEFKELSTEDIAKKQVSLVENINRDVNFIAATARIQAGGVGDTLVKSLGFDPAKIVKESTDISNKAAAGVEKAGEWVKDGIKTVLNVKEREKAKASVQPQNAVDTATAEKAKADAEKAKTQATAATQNGQSNVNLKVTADVRSDDFARLVMKQPEIASKFFDSYDSYTSTAN